MGPGHHMGLSGAQGVHMGLGGSLSSIQGRKGPCGPYGAEWDPGSHMGLGGLWGHVGLGGFGGHMGLGALGGWEGKLIGQKGTMVSILGKMGPGRSGGRGGDVGGALQPSCPPGPP